MSRHRVASLIRQSPFNEPIIALSRVLLRASSPACCAQNAECPDHRVECRDAPHRHGIIHNG